MRTVEIKLYKFEELSEASQQKALEKLWDINVNYEWYEFTYEDAENIGLKISGFDIGRGSYCELSFKYGAKDTAEEILKNHGKSTDTYKLAEVFLEKFEEAETQEANYSELYENIRPETEEEEELEQSYYDKSKEFEEQMNDLSDEFLKDLSDEYLSILQNEFEYLTSEEAIKESIEANDYDFTEDGELY